MLFLLCSPGVLFVLFFFNHTATTEIYTLSLHDALPISDVPDGYEIRGATAWCCFMSALPGARPTGCGDSSRLDGREPMRSEEHTSELQSHSDLVCRLLLEKKKDKHQRRIVGRLSFSSGT